MNPEHFLEIAQALPEPLLLVTSQGEILATNPSVAIMLGRSIKEIRGQMLFELVSEPTDKVLNYLQACSRSRQFVLGSLTFFLADQTSLICKCEGAVIQPLTSESPAFNILRLQKRASASGDFILLNRKIDELTKEVQHRKQAQEELSRRNQELQKTIDKNQKLQQALKEIKEIKLQLIQTEKMSSLGQLVAGIAHEINNPVSFIYSNIKPAITHIEDLFNILDNCNCHDEDTNDELEFLREDLPKLLNSMKVGAERIKQIVLSLRNFSRMDEAPMKEVDMHEGIDSTLMILGHKLKLTSRGKKIDLIKKYGEFSAIECYPSQLNQVFMNLLSNAIDAVDDVESPQIEITTDSVGEMVKVLIRDNGVGIPDNLKHKIFDPFYTTKPVGQGTGMGLGISYQIIERHQGKIWCDSRLGEGATFVIEIPMRSQFIPS
ncbi:PAS domain-containing protein [Calothrix sp. FACHB-156]|nr:PAS domain-containing protein [Nostoc linckia FACHB-104]MBD2338606.1 PAS domain-containing protein [Calothrix sp. FACHB-156]